MLTYQSPYQTLSDLANRDTCTMAQQSPQQILSELANRDPCTMVQQLPYQILSDLANRDQCAMVQQSRYRKHPTTNAAHIKRIPCQLLIMLIGPSQLCPGKLATLSVSSNHVQAHIIALSATTLDLPNHIVARYHELHPVSMLSLSTCN